MLLQHRFDDSDVNIALELFLRMLKDCLGDQLVSVVLYGSILFDDLAPGYGDLDFLAVTRDDLSDGTEQALMHLRKPLRSGEYGLISTMIEGAFIPAKMLDPAVTGHGLWWGTSRERPWTTNELGWFVLKVIRDLGITIWGADIRERIPDVSREQLLSDLANHASRTSDMDLGDDIHAIDPVLTSARMLLWLREGRFSSKSEAADWAYANARGSWREHLPRARYIRRNPYAASVPDVKSWLRSLPEPSRESIEELRAEMAVSRQPTADSD